MSPASARGRWAALREGIGAAWPICLGYVPLGLAFGVLARKGGLLPWEIGLMSLVVFAGSAQFAAVAMLGQGAAAGTIIAATFMINLRHLLMSSALSVHLEGRGRGFLSLFGYGVTDESFAVNLARFLGGNWGPWQALGLNHAANAVWIGSTVMGALAGDLIPAGAFGIDYALPAMFLCLLVFQLRAGIYVITALVAGALALLFHRLVPGNSYVIAATLAAVAAGSALRGALGKRRESG